MTLTPAGLFGRLPNEVLLILLDILPIKDVFSLQWATHNLIPVLQTRTDPCEYFQKQGPFDNASDLLEVMSIHGAVLSGSRALEWFVPGSATATSDWDFYVPPEPTAVTAVKRALERSDVNFKTCLTQAVQKLRSESSVFLNRNQVLSIAYEAYFSPHPRLIDQEIILTAVFHTYPMLQDISPHIQTDGSVSWIADLQPITIGRDGSVSTGRPDNFENDNNCYSHIAPTVLFGAAMKFDRTVPVQLIVDALDPRKQSFTEPTTLFQSVLRSIFRFYGSHVQCFLTKHAAMHMYYRLAVEKVSYQWQVPEVIRERANAAVQKYVGRGFQFSTAPEGEGL